VVTATGVGTELGRVGELVAMIREERTPLERRLDQLGRRLVWLVLVVAAVVGGLGLLRGEAAARVIQTAIALAVAAVPEALPAVATIALAVGLRRMAARHALVRRLAAVEALGSTTVVCSDKTKTLTEGRMTLVDVWTPEGSLRLMDAHVTAAPAPVFLEAMAVAARASRARAAAEPGRPGPPDDPVDAAILAGAERLGLDVPALTSDGAVAGRLPFSSERQLMAAFVVVDGQLTAFVKGAPGRILALCDLDPAQREAFLTVNRTLGAEGLRVLGIATGPVAEATEAGLRDLRFIGLAGIMDPPAPGVKEAIARLREAGLRTIMLTGDQRATAEAVGRELGLIAAGATVLDGRDLAGMSPEALRASVADVAAFSRIAPEHKLSVVRALQDRGEIVAMLGDGVNDAAALKQADVGVAMGVRGTDVAKDAASMVLQDDRFETILAAVEEGRTVYDNIRKFVFYLFSCNLAEVLVLLVAAVAGWPAPLLPLQILWLNMVTDTFPALALALEPGDPDVMRRPPRDPQEAILSTAFLRSIAVYAALITASALGAFAWALARDPAKAATVCFLTLGFAQLFHLGNARSSQHVLTPPRILANRFAIGAVLLTIVLQIAAVTLPVLATALQTTALDRTDWVVVVALALVPAVAGQLFKLRRD
jgi:Ca2+-transporting ATPase